MNTEEQSGRDNEKLVKKYQLDLIVFFVMAVICIGWIGLTLQLPFRTELTWPGLLPLLLLSLILIMILGVFFTIYIPNPEYRNLRHMFSQILKGIRHIDSKGYLYRSSLTMLFLFGYLLLLKILPRILLPVQSYIIATFVFISGITITFKAHKVWVCVLTAVLTTASLYVVFGIFYRVPLP